MNPAIRARMKTFLGEADVSLQKQVENIAKKLIPAFNKMAVQKEVYVSKLDDAGRLLLASHLAEFAGEVLDAAMRISPSIKDSKNYQDQLDDLRIKVAKLGQSISVNYVGYAGKTTD